MAAIEQAGGRVIYQSPSVYSEQGDMTPALWPPIWLVNMIGIEYCDHPRLVSFYNAGSDQALEHAGRISGLEVLILQNAGVTDEGLAHLKGLKNLSALELSGNNRITDRGVAELGGLDSLSELGLWEIQLTDDGLAHLKGLTRLSKLSFSSTR